MQADAHLLTTLKAALVRASEDLDRATAEALRLRAAASGRVSATDPARAGGDGAGYVQMLIVTAAAFEAIERAHDLLRTVAARPTADSRGLIPSPPPTTSPAGENGTARAARDAAKQ